MKYENSIIFLVEPFFHGIQYIDVLTKKCCEYVILRRADGPVIDEEHETYIIDFNKIDTIVELIEKRVSKREYSHIGIIPGNDFCVQYAFEISQKLGLPSNTKESGIGARNKIVMRNMLKMHNVKAPKSQCFYSIEEIENNKGQFAFPLVIKPPDMTSSLFVQQVNSYDELINCAKKILALDCNVLNYPIIKAVLVEEYVQGPEFSIELLLDEGRIIFSSITEKHKGPLPHFVELGHVVPSTVTSQAQEDSLIKTAIAATKAIGLEYGPAHVEIVYTEEGPSVIELAARIGGDNIMKLVREATGIYIPELVVDLALRMNLQIPELQEGGAAIKFITAKPGIVEKIEGFDEIINNPAVVESELGVKVGDRVKQLESSEDRIGYFIVRGGSGIEAINKADELMLNLHIVTNEK